MTSAAGRLRRLIATVNVLDQPGEIVTDALTVVNTVAGDDSGELPITVTDDLTRVQIGRSALPAPLVLVGGAALPVIRRPAGTYG